MTKRIIAIVSICNIGLLTASTAQEISSECSKETAPEVIETQTAPHYKGRDNLNEDMPLKEALVEFNRYLSEPKLTEEEVIASVRRIKSEHPTIPEDVLAIYNRVINERTLPKGMDFRTIGTWDIDGYRYKVDWRDLCLDIEHSGIGKGFGCRIRARFISSRLLTEEDILLANRPTLNAAKFMVEGRVDEEMMRDSPEFKKYMNEYDEWQKKLSELQKQKKSN